MNHPKITGQEKREFVASVRAASGEEFALVGTAASFNKLSGNLGGFREMIAVGAFDRTLNSNYDIKCLASHDTGKVLGSRASGTLKLKADSNGLQFRCALNPNIAFHREVYEVTKAGLANTCSFMFTLNDGDDDWSEGVDEDGRSFVKRTLRSMNLMEISAAVAFPAYPDATRVAARTADIEGDAANRARCEAIGKQILADRIKAALQAGEDDKVWLERMAEIPNN